MGAVWRRIWVPPRFSSGCLGHPVGNFGSSSLLLASPRVASGRPFVRAGCVLASLRGASGTLLAIFMPPRFSSGRLEAPFCFMWVLLHATILINLNASSLLFGAPWAPCWPFWCLLASPRGASGHPFVRFECVRASLRGASDILLGIFAPSQMACDFKGWLRVSFFDASDRTKKVNLVYANSWVVFHSSREPS